MKAKFKIPVAKIISCVIMAIMVIALYIGNGIAYSYEMQLDAYLCPSIVDEESVDAARSMSAAMAKKVETEGAVLLKNENNTLPLSTSEDKKVNVFGYGSVDWVYGGVGNGTSGQVRPENNDYSSMIDLMKALKRYGISYNTALPAFYTDFCKPVIAGKDPNTEISKEEGLSLSEPGMKEYSSDLLSSCEEYSSTAIVVLSRTTAEGHDSPAFQRKRGRGQTTDNSRTYLQISVEEEELLTYVGSHYEKTVVIINAGNVMELEFLDRIPGLDACLSVGLTGTVAASVIPSLLYGENTPSGKLVDTIAYDFGDHPADYSNWFGSGAYSSGGYGTDYAEGIYVGYKWFETADREGVWDSRTRTVLDGAGNSVVKNGYESVVQYPFGYGKSYTSFDWTVKSVSPAAGTIINENSKITVEVEVTNTGDTYSGKDVVEAYITVPYTEGGIEKSHVSLVGFAKTPIALAPKASCVVSIEIDCYDFLSYDCYGKNDPAFKGYVLEEGDYILSLRTDSHNVKNVTFEENQPAGAAEFTYTVSSTIQVANDRKTGQPVGNLFTGDDTLDGFSIDGIESGYNANIPYMSRADFADGYTIPARTNEVRTRALSDGAKSAMNYSTAKANAWDNATTDVFGNEVDTSSVTWGAAGDKKVWENNQITELGLQLGKDFDDPAWEELLNQVTFQEAKSLISKAASGNAAINSVGKPRHYSFDSAIQIKGFAGHPRGTGNPSTTVLAQSWDPKLGYEYGLSFGADMVALNVNNVFGPGVNIHRSPFSGRNWEYFSEDTFVTSVYGCSFIRGLQNQGRGVELKHFALNEQEVGRYGCSTWLSEQAFREIYLRPFRDAVEEENCVGVMTAYNRIGSQWAGGSVAMLTALLRNEWGFDGWVDTDWTTGWPGTIDEQLRAGGDISMSNALGEVTGISYDENSLTPRIQRQMKMAVKHVLYGWLSAQVQAAEYVPEEGQTVMTVFTIESWKWWKPLLTVVDVTVGFSCAIWLTLLFFPGKKSPVGRMSTPRMGR